MSTRIADLTETQLLQEIRKAFEHEALTGIDTEALVNASATLEELIEKISTAIALRNARSA